MDVDYTVKLFLPTLVLEKETCLLLGTKNISHNSCCITNYIILHDDDDDYSDVTVDELENILCHGDGINIIGLLLNGQSGYDFKNVEVWQSYLKSLPEWIILMSHNGELPVCKLYGRWQHQDPEMHATILLFSAVDIDASCLLEFKDPSTNIGRLYTDWQRGTNFQRVCVKENCSFIKGFATVDTNWVHCWYKKFQTHLLKLCLFLTSIIDLLSNNGLMNFCSACYYLPRSAVICQLHKKFKMLYESIICHNDSKLNKIRFTNVLWQQLLDVILGVSALFFLSHHTESIGTVIMDWTEVVAAELEQLLKWMMGVPAGLKLNKELAHFLGQFFIYHIYLWKGYLQFLYPIWTDAVWCISVSGCLGLTIQLSVIQDLFSIMTLHCYCFYVYAARLYSLQVYALQSLWRLFCGKKWNPLFKRVDSSSYDVDQLFIGTLLFTILLFLLPTTGLFYAVFTIFRLLVLAIQGSLYKLVAFTDYLSVYALYLRLLAPSRVAANVLLHVQSRKAHHPLYHHIKLQPVAMLKLFQLINLPPGHRHQTADSWGAFLEKLIIGKLVYPWIE